MSSNTIQGPSVRPDEWLLRPPTDGPAAIILLRMMAGGVFFWEGLLKFIYPNLGVGRFVKLGFPLPELTAHGVACLEVLGGLCLILGVATRLVAAVFVVEMIVAMLSTKVGLFMGVSPLPLPPSPPKQGLWAVLHEIRSEYAQLMTCLFLVLIGPGPYSLDRVLRKTRG